MSRAFKNFEIFGDSCKPVPIAHQRPIKLEDIRSHPSDLNLWKIFSKVPRTRSVKQNEQKQQENNNDEQEQFMVISTFKNSQCTADSPMKQFRAYNKIHIKRYISDDGFTLNKKIDSYQKMVKDVEKSISCTPVSISKCDKPFPISPFQYQQSVNQTIYKRSVLSGHSELKAKYRIKRDGSRRHHRTTQQTTSKVKLPELKEEKKYPVLMKGPNDLKQLKSQSYLLIEYPSERVIVGHRASISLQIASLTKIMTYYTIVKFAKDKGFDLKNEKITVSAEVYNIGGTSAQIVEGEQYTVDQLLYGLMLPSGNDAANELAYWMGAYLVGGKDLKAHFRAFISEMNKNAIILGLKNTKFANPHGLPNNLSKSTANDVAKLCCICMKLENFRYIVKQQCYRFFIKNGTSTREVVWENTNKLLRRKGFVGIKTGITVTAGPCLASAYEFRDKTYISVILRAPKVSARFKDTRILIHWALTRLFKNDLSEDEKQILKVLKRHDRDLDSDYSEDEHEFRYDCGDAGQLRRRCKILSNQL